jgi:hypothetical protein
MELSPADAGGHSDKPIIAETFDAVDQAPTVPCTIDFLVFS